MSQAILVVGTVGLDDIETPFGSVKGVLGGSATYFAAAAGLYAPVNLVAVAGSDFPQEHLAFLRSRNVDLEGFQLQPGATFRWVGRYAADLNVAETIETHLNVVETFQPQVPGRYRATPFVFLANGPPQQQAAVLDQLTAPRLTLLDTMNLWIETQRAALLDTIRRVDVVTINESEARLLASTSSIVAAARMILSLGPKVVLVKKGEYGAVMFTDGGYFVTPAYPLEEVRDPTGAGDSFAGGFLGYLARTGEVTMDTLRRAVVHGSAVASFTVEAFSVERLRTLTLAEVEERYHEFRTFTHFEPL